MAEIDFSTTHRDFEIISRIASRAMGLASSLGQVVPKQEFLMDLSAVHNRYGLKLGSLLDADDRNFGHDVFGIRRHLNRETGELEDCFCPRFSAPKAAA